MTTLIIALLVLWLIFAVIGSLIEGLFWLLIVGVVLFIGTAIYGWIRSRASA